MRGVLVTAARVAVQGCKVVAEIAKPDFKARMTVPLAVAGAFHTDYMGPAVEKLKEALESTPITAPRIPVVSNVDAEPHSDPDTIKDILARQVCPVYNGRIDSWYLRTVLHGLLTCWWCICQLLCVL